MGKDIGPLPAVTLVRALRNQKYIFLCMVSVGFCEFRLLLDRGSIPDAPFDGAERMAPRHCLVIIINRLTTANATHLLKSKNVI
jgi:hypothetical protein